MRKHPSALSSSIQDFQGRQISNHDYASRLPPRLGARQSSFDIQPRELFSTMVFGKLLP